MEKLSIKTYKDLIFWQKSMDLVTAIYKLTVLFPQTEMYGLTSQIKRCCISIPSNIAEGKMRNSRKDYSRFLAIAYGSGAELETQIEIAKRLSFVNEIDCLEADALLLEVMKMLNKAISTLTPKT